jgi:hypothetical protein
VSIQLKQAAHCIAALLSKVRAQWEEDCDLKQSIVKIGNISRNSQNEPAEHSSKCGTK